jgi:SAM-dependent methyltransferase
MQVNLPGQDGQKRIPRYLYENLDDHFGSAGSRRSAQEIVPFLVDLIKPQSVIDVGCGVGSWLAVFLELGVRDILGVDVGYLDRSLLKISEVFFKTVDLKKPLSIDRSFDLVLCLEVAGYLPEKDVEVFLNSLVGLGPVILFSSAIPFQDLSGFQVNQQWQDYWVKHFQSRNYVAIDCLREKVWDNANVAYWFSQNMLLFVDHNYLESHDPLKREIKDNSMPSLNLVHPHCYLEKCHQLQSQESSRSLRSILSELPPAIVKVVKRKLGLTA